MPLRSIHGDVVFAGVPGLDGEYYFACIADEATKFIWIISLRKKGQLAAHLQALLTREQRRLHSDIYKFTRDGGTEFIGLKEYFRRTGIHDRQSVPYDHNSNGLIESLNRVITERARAILHSSRLPLTYWPLAVHYAAKLHNHLSGASEALYGSPAKPKLQGFYTFGAQVEILIPKEKRPSKFSTHSEPGVFLGREEDDLAYIVWTKSGIQRARTIKVINNTCSLTFLHDLNVDFDIADVGDWKEDEEPTFWMEENLSPQHEPVSAEIRSSRREQSSKEASSTSEVISDRNPRSERREDCIVPADDVSQKRDSNRVRRKAHIKASKNISRISNQLVESAFDEALAHSFLNCLSAKTTSSPSPNDWSEAIADPSWKESMEKEIASLKKRNTWELRKWDPNIPTLRCIWVFRTKPDGSLKSRLTIDGRDQRFFTEIFAAVGTRKGLRLITSHALSHN